MKKQYVITILAITLVACGGNPKEPASSGHDHHAHAGAHHSGNARNYADSVNSGLIANDTMKSSPRRTAMNNIGACHVHVDYGSPGVKGRTIWGGLVAYGAVWASGAHMATTVDFSADVVVAGKPVKAGTYALFTIPGETEWAVILNTRYDQHLADQYDPKEDVVRVALTPQRLETPVQRLTYTVQTNSDTSGFISLEWEHIQITLPIAAKPK